MKYKTLCRLLVRLIGVYLLAMGVASIWTNVLQVISMLGRGISGRDFREWALWAMQPLGSLTVGGYLFFGGKWVVDKLIPSNRPYCHECGYDLSGSVGNVCAECGTAFKPIVKDVEPHH